MKKCSKCNINNAVVFTTRFESGKTLHEGLCLKCAYKSGLGGLDNIFSDVGLTDDNIDEITGKLENLMNNPGFDSPHSMLKSLVESVMDEDGEFSDLFQGVGDSASLSLTKADDDEEDKKPKGLPSDTPSRREENLPGTPKSIRLKQARGQRRKRKFLDQFGSNLTQRASEGKIDRVIGREKELTRVVQILNRRTKNNPVLLGEPGVGKTAIAEGLAVKISQGQVPYKLRELEVYLIDLTAMVAGTQFRGQFESRMKGVVDDAKREGNIVLVIDELHNIMGAGDAEGAMNAGNILKPALAKGEIKVLGSTTLNEYRKFIEKDSALERRFQQVVVVEPDLQSCVEILMGIKDYYEQHHGVVYDEKVIKFAVKASHQYISDRYLPDKAIDLIDEAGSIANLKDETSDRLMQVEKRIKSLKNSLQSIENLMIEKPEDEKLYEYQAEIKTNLCNEEDKFEHLKNSVQPVEITVADIAEIIEMWTGIPVQKLTEDESDRLLDLEESLKSMVIGQETAITALASAVRRKRAGFTAKNKPSSFIFVGPTGVGKTELAKSLALSMFGDENNLIRLDMSEFMESHTVSKMIGSPPGYVGFDDGGQLTEKVRRKPYSILLFDEIEKAHPQVFNILLQVLDDGRLTDSHGRVVNFENTTIIMTSNAGTTLKAHGFGFGSENQIALESRVDKALKEIFRPEFLNRVDEIIVFNELSKEDLREIADLMLKEVYASMEEKGMRFLISDEVKDYLTDQGYDDKFGARPLRKTIHHLIEDPLSDMLFRGELEGVIGVSAVMGEDGIIFETL